jgi:acetyl esterase/lipase
MHRCPGAAYLGHKVACAGARREENVESSVTQDTADAVILDPEVEPLLAEIPTVALSVGALAEVRALRNEFFVELGASLPDGVERTDHVIDDDTRVFVRVHRPQAQTEVLPCVYSIHGGGYVLGSVEMDDARFAQWCQKLGCVGVSVEYRLAPETPFPAPLEDCYAGLRWTYEHAGDLGIDRRGLGIAGASAGGGLAAALALLARDRGEVPLAFQLLECPMLDDRQMTSSSRLDGLPIWSRESNAFGWRSYLGDLYGTDRVPPYAAAARAEDLEGLPPALVITGGADGFRDENILYGQRLNQAGVATDLHVLAGAPHGVQMFIGSDIARRWNAIVTEWLRLQFARGMPR